MKKILPFLMVIGILTGCSKPITVIDPLATNVPRLIVQTTDYGTFDCPFIDCIEHGDGTLVILQPDKPKITIHGSYMITPKP